MNKCPNCGCGFEKIVKGSIWIYGYCERCKNYFGINLIFFCFVGF